jgi:ceramide glucosyltransferase
LLAFTSFLAEDNMIASSLMHELQTRHELSCDVVHTGLGSMSFSAYVNRRVRWIRVRKHMVLSATLLEPFTESVLAGTLMCLGLRHVTGAISFLPLWLVFILHTLVWLTIDLSVYESLASHPVPSNIRASFISSWILRELLTFPIFLWAVFGSDVSWRGVTYRMKWNGHCVKRESLMENSLNWFTRFLPRRNQYSLLPSTVA